MSNLFPAEFVQGIQRLRMSARRVPHGRDSGDHASRFSGSGMEFRDYRPYAAGDDLRRLDWNVFRRSRRLMLRLFEEPRRVSMHVLLDLSDSMFFESPPRGDAARQVAAALAAAAHSQHDEVTVYPFGSGLRQPTRLRSRGGLPPLLDWLGRQQPCGRTNLPTVLRQLANLRLRRGVLAIVSDFFEPAGLEAVLAELDRVRHRLVLVQLTREADAEPALSGDVELEDCETGQLVRVAVDQRVAREHRARYEAFNERLRSFATGRHAPLLRVDAGRPVLGQIERLFTGGVLRL